MIRADPQGSAGDNCDRSIKSGDTTAVVVYPSHTSAATADRQRRSEASSVIKINIALRPKRSTAGDSAKVEKRDCDRSSINRKCPPTSQSQRADRTNGQIA